MSDKTATKDTKAKDAKTKEPKQKKEKKDVEETSDKQKDGLNEATRKSGLTFNVNKFREWVKRQFETFGIKEDEYPKLTGAHIALSALIESMASVIVEACNVNATKEKSGLYNISAGTVGYSVQQNQALRETFLIALSKFDPDTDYRTQFCIPKEDVVKFVETKLGSSNHKLESSGLNCLVYLLNAFAVRVTKTALKMMTVAKHKSLHYKHYTGAVEVHCHDNVAVLITKKIEDAKTLAGKGEDEADSDEKETKEDAKEEDEEEVKEEKKESAKKESGKKEAKKDSPKKEKAKKEGGKKEAAKKSAKQETKKEEKEDEDESSESENESEDEKPKKESGKKKESRAGK
jgi:hypothetical protein